MDLKLRDKIVMITGATKGIGKATMELFLEEGAIVIAVARDVSMLQQNEHLIPFSIDVSKDDEIQDLFSLVSSRFSQLDALINNVGSNIRKSTLEYSDDDFEAMFNVNTKSTYELSRSFYPLLKTAKGAIVNVSSVASEKTIKTSTLVYAMTKASVNQMTKFLANEWGKDGIRVNAVLPWYISTVLTKPVLQDPDKLKLILEKTPLGRVGEPEEVANVIAFLASSKSSYMSGTLVPIDGGFLS